MSRQRKPRFTVKQELAAQQHTAAQLAPQPPLPPLTVLPAFTKAEVEPVSDRYEELLTIVKNMNSRIDKFSSFQEQPKVIKQPPVKSKKIHDRPICEVIITRGERKGTKCGQTQCSHYYAAKKINSSTEKLNEAYELKQISHSSLENTLEIPTPAAAEVPTEHVEQLNNKS